MVLESGEGRGHAAEVPRHPPVVDPLDGHGVKVVPTHAALAPNHDQPGGLEDAEVLHDGGATQAREPSHQCAGGLGSPGQCVEQGPTGRVGR